MIELDASASLTRCITREDLAAMAALTGNAAPDHITLPHVFSLFSCLLGETLPGRGTNYLKQSGSLLGRIAPGTELCATVTVTRLRPEKHLVDLRTVCHDKNSRLLCEGRALVLAPHAFDTQHA